MRLLAFWSFLILPLFGFGNLTGTDPEFGIIKGQITTSDNEPAQFVTVSLKGTSHSVLTDEYGNFVIYKVKAGSYELETSLVGYESKSQQVTVDKNNIVIVNLQLTVSDSQLQEVIVSQSKNRFANKKSDGVARMPLRNLENPQVYNVVGKSLMSEQLVTERTEIYRNVPGAVPNFAAGGSQGLTMRGFQNTQGTRNGMNTSAIVPLNPAILESIEFIKGPVGTLYGGSRGITFGGSYNYVTKKPYDRFGGEISYAGGSYGFNRVMLDVNTPVSIKGEQNAFFRLVGAYQSENSFQYQGFAKNYTIAPSFKYKVNDRLTFTVEAEFTRGNYTTYSLALPSNLSRISARNLKDLNIGYKQSLINNSVDINNGINNIQAEIEYKISEQWKSQTKYLYSEGFYKDFFWTTLTMIDNDSVARSTRNQTPETFGNIEVQQNFIGDFRIGSLRNRIVAGFDYNYNFNELNRVTVAYDKIDLRQNIAIMSAEKLNAMSALGSWSNSTTKTYNYGAYVSDVLNITPQLMAMLSLRFDRYNSDGTFTPATQKYAGGYNQTSWSPKLGLVYQVVKDQVSVFANYMNGFVNQGPVTQGDNTILVLEPQFGNQWEGGLKMDLFRNKLSATISVYEIAVTNSTRVENIDGKNFTRQDGTQNSKGVEVELIANPVSGLNIVAGYAFNENKYKKASATLEGKYVMASPKNLANLWVSYSLQKGKAKGLGFGAGGNYVTDSWFEASNSFVLPGYTLLNATVFYDQPAYRVAIKANNMLNEKYWNSNGIAQKPANILVSVGFKF